MDDRVRKLEQLSAYLDGELTAEQALDLERALADDAEMAAELESLRKTRQLLRDLPAEPAPHDFAHRVMARSRLLHPVARAGIGGAMRASRWISFAAAAVVLIAAGAGMYIVVSSAPPAAPEDRLAAGPEAGPMETRADITVADLPVERIFAADLLMAQQDVADVLVRNGVAMTDYVETTRHRRALAAPVAGTINRMSQTVQVASDTVEIEVLVEPAVAKQILTELTEVQDRQVAMVAVGGMHARFELEAGPESNGPALPAPAASAPADATAETAADALGEDGSAEDKAAGERVALEALPRPADGTDDEADEDELPAPSRTLPSPAEAPAVRGHETRAAASDAATPAAEPPADAEPYAADVEDGLRRDVATSRGAAGRETAPSADADLRADLEADAAALPDESREDKVKDDGPVPSEEGYAPTGRQPGRPWFGEDDETAAAAAEPAEEHAQATVVADDEDTAEELAAPGGESPTAEDRRFADDRADEWKDEPGKSLPYVPAEGDSDGAGVATTGAEVDAVEDADKLAKARQPTAPQAVRLQRLVIVLQQVPAEQLPAQADPRGENAETWRRASGTSGE